jgi:hypothetical protein
MLRVTDVITGHFISKITETYEFFYLISIYDDFTSYMVSATES